MEPLVPQKRISMLVTLCYGIQLTAISDQHTAYIDQHTALSFLVLADS
jgi:hypothetical protein